MRKLTESQVDKFYAIAGTSVIGLGGLAYTAYHISKMTQVVMIAGSVPADGAIESMELAVDGVPYTLSVIPASLGMKVFVAGIFVAIIAVVAWYTYRSIKIWRENKRKAIAEKELKVA